MGEINCYVVVLGRMNLFNSNDIVEGLKKFVRQTNL